MTHIGQSEVPTVMTMDPVTAMDVEQMFDLGLRILHVSAIFGSMGHFRPRGCPKHGSLERLRCHHQVRMAMAGEGRSQAGATSRRA
jgi:hypothetical protein